MNETTTKKRSDKKTRCALMVFFVVFALLWGFPVWHVFIFSFFILLAIRTSTHICTQFYPNIFGIPNESESLWLSLEMCYKRIKLTWKGDITRHILSHVNALMTMKQKKNKSYNHSVSVKPIAREKRHLDE